jgi:hypothetical protein
MNLRHRLARSRFLLAGCAAALIVTLSGCADMLPDSDTWAKWSPSNIWYRMQPTQLGRLNEGNGIASDVYYSVSDDPERDRAAAVNPGADHATTVVQPIENAAPATQP